jgi:nucleoside phosphorylase
MKPAIGIVAATRWEVKPWLSLSRSKAAGILQGNAPIFSALVNDTPVVTVIGGIGLDSARRAAENLLAAHKPAALFSVGFAGSLIPDLKVGDFVVEGRTAGLDLAALGLARERIKVRVGHVASAKEVLDTPRKKRVFHTETGADAVDMEWEGVKAACRQAGVLCAAVKIISDATEERIPLPRGLKKHTGLLTGSRVLAESLKDPFSLPKTIWFGARSSRLSKNLAGFIREFITLTVPLVERAGPGRNGKNHIKICL